MLSILIQRLVIGEVDCLAEYSDPVFYKNLFCAMEPRPENRRTSVRVFLLYWAWRNVRHS